MESEKVLVILWICFSQMLHIAYIPHHVTFALESLKLLFMLLHKILCAWKIYIYLNNVIFEKVPHLRLFFLFAWYPSNFRVRIASWEIHKDLLFSSYFCFKSTLIDPNWAAICKLASTHKISFGKCSDNSFCYTSFHIQQFNSHLTKRNLCTGQDGFFAIGESVKMFRTQL